MAANINNTIVNATITPAAAVTATIQNGPTIKSNVQNGARGKSAYEVWLYEGHVGSAADFLYWLRSDSYKHVQSVSSSEWIITHNLNKYPSVTIVDSANTIVVGEVQYLDLNNIKVYFEAEFSGQAFLN